MHRSAAAAAVHAGQSGLVRRGTSRPVGRSVGSATGPPSDVGGRSHKSASWAGGRASRREALWVTCAPSTDRNSITRGVARLARARARHRGAPVSEDSGRPKLMRPSKELLFQSSRRYEGRSKAFGGGGDLGRFGHSSTNHSGFSSRPSKEATSGVVAL